MKIGLEERRKALEEAFFRKEDARLVEELHRRLEQEREVGALARACGMPEDSPGLRELVRHGVGTSTLPALILAPLVEVAWASGEVTRLERLELLARARELGVEPGSPCHALLETWLHHKPHPALYAAWRDYARALVQSLDPEQREVVEQELLWRAREVATASGGVLRFGRRVSEAERRVLHDLEHVFASS